MSFRSVGEVMGLPFWRPACQRVCSTPEPRGRDPAGAFVPSVEARGFLRRDDHHTRNPERSAPDENSPSVSILTHAPTRMVRRRRRARSVYWHDGVALRLRSPRTLRHDSSSGDSTLPLAMVRRSVTPGSSPGSPGSWPCASRGPDGRPEDAGRRGRPRGPGRGRRVEIWRRRSPNGSASVPRPRPGPAIGRPPWGAGVP